MNVVVQKNAMQLLVLTLALLAALFLLPSASARVVINEIMYHAPDDLEDLEYIELYNSGGEAADIAGWSLAKGVKVKFPAGTKIGPKGFLVVARNAARLSEFFGIQPAMVFSQKLKNDGERIELLDTGGMLIDVVHYRDRAPWPTGADGHSGSLERIDSESSGENPANWLSSPLSANRKKPTGTPGKPNTVTALKLPPIVANVRFAPEDPAPNQTITVEAEVKASGEIKEVVLLYRLAGPGVEKAETALPMRAAAENRFTAAIPAQAKDSLIRFRVRATDATGSSRFYPAETEPRPALSLYVR